MTATATGKLAGPDGASAPLSRALALSIVALCLVFLANNYLIFWQGWPGLSVLYADLGWFGARPLKEPLSGGAALLGWLQLFSYPAAIAAVLAYAFATRSQPLRLDAERLAVLSAFIVRGAFWSVLIVGLVDMAISFLRVEGFLEAFVGADLTTQLGRSQFRGAYVHLPLIFLSFVIALFTRTLGFIWLALLVVVAEFQIVIARFIFSYEQAFMGDLVRFWYAALFLFASAYTLIEEGHVRVDVLYVGFNDRTKAWANALGSLILGLPLTVVILMLGHWSKAAIINSPILSFETSQSGFGLYVKYLMAGYLAIFALTMLIQFMSYFLSSVADLRGEPGGRKPAAAGGH